MVDFKPRLGILCIGNILLLDEGFGPALAARLLAAYDFPPQVEVLDRACMGMALLADIRRFDELLVIDAVDNSGKPAGTVVSFTPNDIAPYAAPRGAHDMRLADVLAAAALLGPVPACQCLGVQVLDMNPPQFSIGLTPPVQAALQLVEDCVLGWLAQRGVNLRP